MRSRSRSWARESPRDQDESAFTPILRHLLHRTTGVLAAAFVDDQGECIDYASALPPFDAKVAGAHLRVVMNDVTQRLRPSHGQAFLIEVQAGDRDLIVRRIADDYLLAVVVKARGVTRRLLGGVEQAVEELRREGGIAESSWEPWRDPVKVELRDAVGWPYAPNAFLQNGRRVVVDDVLGRWTEGAGRASRICFRVRTQDGEELTLVHDRADDSWERQRERHH
ncbi:MAG: hypothetical protein ACFCGT_21875 [Sandaracinaceae bacterium]